MRAIRNRMTFANVVSVIALFVALGGSAYAATQLKKNSVGTKQIKNSAVTAAKIKRGAISATKIASAAVNGSNVQTGSLTGSDLQNGSVTGAQINQGSLNDVRADNVTGIEVAGVECTPVLGGSYLASSERTGTGVCKLTFHEPPTNCTITATADLRGGVMPIFAEQRTAEVVEGSPNVLYVDTWEGSGLADEAFDLMLVC